ncbi:MAG TPA: nitroreductase/quinone reductase family protein [Kineosporiaceae bacterium]
MITIGLPGASRARDIVRQFNKHLLNPAMLTLAGRRFWYAAAIHHIGRRSGTRYITPVVADEIDGGYLVPLPYGTAVDWLHNVQAAGHATLDVHGRTVTVTDPEVLTAVDALPLMPATRARLWQLLRMEHFLRLRLQTQTPHRTPPPSGGEPGERPRDERPVATPLQPSP